MISFDVNWLTILACGVMSMIIGFLWYSPFLFGKAWLAGLGKQPGDCKQTNKQMGITYGLTFASTILQAFILAQFVEFVGAISVLEGLMLGLMVWAGFILTVMGSGALFHQKPIKVFLIDVFYQFVTTLTAAVILALWV